MARDLDRNQDDYAAEMRKKYHDLDKYQLFDHGIGLPPPVGKQYRGQRVKAAALEPDKVLSSRIKDQTLRDLRFMGVPWNDPNVPGYDRGNTSRPAVPGEPGAQQYRGQDVRVAGQMPTSDSQQKTLLFLHGMESRYGKTKPAQVEAQAKAYADKRGMGFEAIPISGDNHRAQQVAAQKRINQGGVGAVLGFSAGGYTASHLKTPKGVEKIIVGAPRAKGNQTFPGRHMDQVKGLAGSAPKQQGQQSRYQPQPLPTGSKRPPADIPGGAIEYLARTATPAGTMSRQGGATAAISRLNPEFASRLQSGIQALRENGYPNAGIASAFRSGSGSAGTGSKFDRAGQSLHSIGAAVDLTGIGGPGSKQAAQAHQILRQHGVYGVYGPNNRAEYNHFQLVPQKSVSALGGDPAMVRQFAGSHVPTDDQMHQLWGIADKRLAQSSPRQSQQASARSTFPPQPPAVNTGAQGAANRAAGLTTKMPTVAQLIAQNRNNPQFAPYASMAGSIPDQHLPVDQWKQKHADLYNNPMVPQGVKSIFDNAMQTRPPATQAQMAGVQQPSMIPQQQGPQSTAGNPLNVPKNLTPSEQRGVSQFGASLPQQQRPQSQFPPMPQARPMQAPSMQDQAVNNIRPPDQQQPQPQPPTTMMPPTAGGQPNNAQPIMGGAPQPPQPPPMPPPMPPQQPGLGAGTPFGGPQMGMGSPQASMGMSGPVVGGGDGMGMGGGMFSGMGGGMGGMGGGMGGSMGGGGDAGGGMGGGGHGGGSKVNMQAAMQMIPKPIALPPLEGGIQPIQPGRPMPPQGQGGNMSLAQSIMQFLQGGEA